MTGADLITLARTRMRDPHVYVYENSEHVWIGRVTDFDRAQGAEVHGLSEAFVRTALEGVLRCFPELERNA